MNKNFFFTTLILVPAFFLIVLGMRNTSLDHTLGPKQRPRAVLENVVKSPIITSCQLHLDTGISPSVAVATRAVENKLLPAPVREVSSSCAPNLLPSRASPLLPSRPS